METNGDGTSFQEGDLVRIKRTGEQGHINAVDGGVVYVIMDETQETKLFSASSDEDASIEIVTHNVGSTAVPTTFSSCAGYFGRPFGKQVNVREDQHGVTKSEQSVLTCIFSQEASECGGWRESDFSPSSAFSDRMSKVASTGQSGLSNDEHPA